MQRGPAATVNYRPVLSAEMALQNNKPQLSKRKSQGERKIGRGSQMGAWREDGLADWLPVVMWLRLRQSVEIWRERRPLETATKQHKEDVVVDTRERERGVTRCIKQFNKSNYQSKSISTFIHKMYAKCISITSFYSPRSWIRCYFLSLF
jgi:hypothetical protein